MKRDVREIGSSKVRDCNLGGDSEVGDLFLVDRGTSDERGERFVVVRHLRLSDRSRARFEALLAEERARDLDD
jgi:hypothetical protein